MSITIDSDYRGHVIGFHGRRDSRFKVETRHIAEGAGAVTRKSAEARVVYRFFDPDPYDQIKIRGDGYSDITLYISREQTQRLREALTRLVEGEFEG